MWVYIYGFAILIGICVLQAVISGRLFGKCDQAYIFHGDNRNLPAFEMPDMDNYFEHCSSEEASEIRYKIGRIRSEKASYIKCEQDMELINNSHTGIVLSIANVALMTPLANGNKIAFAVIVGINVITHILFSKNLVREDDLMPTTMMVYKEKYENASQYIRALDIDIETFEPVFKKRIDQVTSIIKSSAEARTNYYIFTVILAVISAIFNLMT